MSPQERGLGKLCPCIRKKLDTLMSKMGGLQVLETLRQLDRQKYYVSIGVSWTMRSRHLASPPNAKSLAVDVVPKKLLKEKGWAPASILWQNMGELGESLGLTWGGRWKQRDLSHFELDACECP